MLVSLIVSAEIVDSYGFNILAAQLNKLKSKGVRVQSFFIFYKFNELYPKQVVEDLVDLCKGSDLIGISLLSSAYRNSIQITQALREKIGCPIIWGGKHPTADPESCIQYADIIGLSEGEDTLLEIVENMLLGKSYEEVMGIWFKKNSKIIKTLPRPIEHNLDKFLFPDYSPENKFILDKKTFKIRPCRESDLDDMRKRFYPTMITRGCPNCCTFCTNSTDLKLRKMRSRSIDNVFKEIKDFLKVYPDTKHVFFRDDCISAMSLEFIREFSYRWKNEIGLTCGCSGVIATSPDFKEKINLLAEAGFQTFKMGIQSGCERIRRQVYARVGETDEVILKAVSVLHSTYKKGLRKANYYMITDNPYESEEELIKSIRFTSRIIRPFSLSLYSLNFYPGTALYNRAIRGGILKDKNEALQESTMILKNTYLNKVFLTLRHLEIPPYLVDIMTNKKIYANSLYQKTFNLIFHFLFRSDIPSRNIKRPLLKREISKLIKYKKFDFLEVLRWFIWKPIELLFRLSHRLAVRDRYRV